MPEFIDNLSPPKPDEPLFITLPVALLYKDFFHWESGGGHYMNITAQSGMLISAADKQKKYFTVEWPDKENRNSTPRLWVTKDYLQSMEHRRELKLNSELYRQRSYVWERNFKNLCYNIAKMTGMKRDEEGVVLIAKKVIADGFDYAYEAFKCKQEKFDEVTFVREWKLKHGG